MSKLTNLEKKLNFEFKNKKILERALIHRSYLNENREKNLGSNERLEFLGDAVLSLVISQYLYLEFTSLPEGDLTNYRASLVKTQTLARVAQSLDLGNHLMLSRGEEDSGGRQNLGLLADVFEALIGAMFLDQGLAKVASFIINNLTPILPEIIKTRSFKDYKSQLQEKMQAEDKVSPQYKVLNTRGPDHERIFTIGVYLNNKLLGEGQGHSKQEAQQEAAKVALEKITDFR